MVDSMAEQDIVCVLTMVDSMTEHEMGMCADHG